MAMGSQDSPFLSANGYRYGGYSESLEKKLAKDNPSSPYYLSKSEEDPTLHLTPHLLTLSNYHLWRQDVLLSLLEKRKLGFLTGSIKPLSPDDVNYECWRSCSDMVQSWIIHSLSPEVSATVSSSSSSCARVLWLDLQERYSKGNKRSRIRIAQLRHDISRLSQGFRSVADYFSEFKQLWDELENLLPIPVCKCSPSCNCDALAIICNYRREEKLLKFLNGLVFNFPGPNPFKYRILLTEPLPTVDQVLAMPQTQRINWRQNRMDTIMEVGKSESEQPIVADDNPFKNHILMTEPLPTFSLDTTMEEGKSKSEQPFVEDDNFTSAYSRGNKSRIRMEQLHHDVSEIREGFGSVTIYFAEFKKLWDELADFWPIPTCKCSPACKCDALRIIRNYRHEDQIVRFLNGLQEDFEPVKNCILLTEPLPTLDQVLAMFEQVEAQRCILRTGTRKLFTYYFASASDPVAVVPTSFPLQSTWCKKLASGSYLCNLCGKECRPSIKHGMIYAGCQQLVGPGGKFRPWIYIHQDNSVTNSADCQQHLAPRLSGKDSTSPPFFNSVVVPMDTPRAFDQQILDPDFNYKC